MNLLGDCGYARNDIQTILDSPIPYTKDDEEQDDEEQVALVEVCMT